MSNLVFNPKDPVSVRTYMETLDTQDKLLENSMYIYSTDSDVKRSALESVLRYADLTLEQYGAEKSKVDAVIKAAIENNLELSDRHQTFLVESSKLLGTRIMQVIDEKYHINKLNLAMLENDIAYGMDMDYVTESMNPYGESMIHNLKEIDKESALTVRGMYECCDMLVSPLNPMSDNEKCALKQGLKEKICNTMRYECNNSDYYDLPLLQAMKSTKACLKDVYADMDIDDKIDTLFDEIENDVDEIFDKYIYQFAHENGFNPDPFNIYNLTPLPVGVRTINRSYNDLVMAETDEEILEALINIGRIMHACENADPSIILEKEHLVNTKKATRAMARASAKGNRKTVSFGKDMGEVGSNVGKIFEPWVRYVEELKDKMQKADNEQRRNYIIKGSTSNKLIHFISRGVKALIAGTIAGAFGGPIVGAIITAIVIVAAIATDKECDDKEKTKILAELEDELQIVEEKIEDCRGEEDKSKKYELMRIRNQLKRETNRINLGLKA